MMFLMSALSKTLLFLVFFSTLMCLQFEKRTAHGEEIDKDWIKVEYFLDKKEYPSAERAIERYVRKHPEIRKAYIIGGRTARKFNLPEEGLRIIDMGLEKFPSDTTLLRMKAELEMERGNLFIAKIILFDLFQKIAFRQHEGLLSEINDQSSRYSDRQELPATEGPGGKSARTDSLLETRPTESYGIYRGYEFAGRIQAKEVNALIEKERKRAKAFLSEKKSRVNEFSPYPRSSVGMESPSERRSSENSSEMKKAREDEKVLEELALSIPPPSTYDQNTNFQQIIPPPSQTAKTYSLENDAYHLRLTNVDLLYSGGGSFESGIAVETPLQGGIVHFQAGTNEYLGSASAQGTALSSYTYAGVDGEGPDDIEYLLDAGNTNGGGLNDAGLYTHADVPIGPILIDAQGWYQLPWSSYGQALLLGGLHSGALMTTTWNVVKRLSLSGTYEFTYDTLHGSQTPFGYNHNSLVTLDWEFLDWPDLHLVAGYDSQGFAALVPDPGTLVPVLQSSDFWSAGLSTLDQIGHILVLNGQAGGIYGRFGNLNSMTGLQVDGGLSLQITPRFEFYGNLSYESMAASYIGPVTTMMYGINIWF